MKQNAAALLEELRQTAEELPPELQEADGDMPADQAIDLLTKIVAREGTLTALGTAAVCSLQQHGGEAALEAVLEAHGEAEDVNARHNLADALAGFDVQDTRVIDVLLERIETAPNRSKLPTWIVEIARHGNPGALPRLCAWFEAAELDPADVLDRLVAQSIGFAVETLGGEFVGEQGGQSNEAQAPAEATSGAKKPTDTTSGPLQYDASTDPDQNRWLAADEQARVMAICQYHVDETPHPQPDDLGRHAMAHAIVENHIAEDFPGIREAFERLQQEGLTRHEAVHALGEKAMALIAPVLESDTQLDPNALIEAYQQASATD